MKKVIVKYSEAKASTNIKNFVFKPITSLWPLLGAVIPAIFIYGAIAYGSPAILVSQNSYKCFYIDLMGEFYIPSNDENCRWYGFRDLNIFSEGNKPEGK